MGKRERRNTYGMWATTGTRDVLRADGMQTAATYIRRSQGTVVQWVDTLLIFKVCAWEKGFEGGGHRSRPCWLKEAMREVLRATLKEALREARIR